MSRRPDALDWFGFFLFLAILAIFVAANALRAQTQEDGWVSDSVVTRLQRENDSLRQRVWVLTGAVREYILAADHYATQARNAEALLSWYRNRPDHCVDRTRNSLHPAGQTLRTSPADTIAQGD